jgi:hypothetical protein
MATSIVNPWFVLTIVLFLGAFWSFEYTYGSDLDFKHAIMYAFWTIFGIVVISILLSVC